MTGKWKSKMYDGCRECHHVSKNQGRWTDTCVPIWMGCLRKETQESKHRAAFGNGISWRGVRQRCASTAYALVL